MCGRITRIFSVLCLLLLVFCLRSFAYPASYQIPALTGNQAEDVAIVAKSQLGYTESGGTEYGAWWNGVTNWGVDYTYSGWCAMFACWCADKAGAGMNVAYNKNGASPGLLFDFLKTNGASYDTSMSGTPQTGDFIFFGHSSVEHVAIVTGYNASTRVVSLVGGNQGNGAVTASSCSWKAGAYWGGQQVLGYGRPKYKNIPKVAQLDVNGWLDGNNSGSVSGYATFDMYINGSKVSDDVNDFYQPVNIGSSYEIKDIKVMTGKALEGYSSVATGGYVSGGRTGTVNSNTDVRLQLHTVDATGFLNSHALSLVSTYNGHSYYFFDAPVTWYDAKIISEYLGGHLVTITSAEENNFVKEMIGNANCWIGATDSAAEGVWKWVNNETFSYSHWASGNPDNFAGEIEGQENYAHIWTGGDTWNDNAGCVAYPFMYEIDRAYTVSYNTNGGEGKIASQEKAVGQTITLSTSVPVRSGYSFIGWAADPDAAESEYASGAAYGEDEDITLYAVWEKDCDHQVIYAVETAPTFGSEGKLSGTCSICGRKVEKVLPVLNETDYQCEVKEPSMCMEDGIMSYVWNTEEGQTFSFETVIPALGHNYVATENPPTCSDYGSITHTCSRCGDSYTEYLPKPDDSDAWTIEKPVGVPDEQIETKTQYRYRELTTKTSTESSMTGWTPTGSNTSYGNWGNWSGWRKGTMGSSDTRDVETASVYTYYYFLCPNCGAHMHVYTSCYSWAGGCGANSMSVSNYVEVYDPTPWSSANCYNFHSTGRYATDSLAGLGRVFQLPESGGQAAAGYRYRDRSKTITYTYEKWGDWSPWEDTEYTASSTRQVETRILYKYETDIDSRHRWGAPVYTWDEGTDTLTAEYTCELDSSHKKTETMENLDVLRLPAGLQSIEEEAFEGTASQVIIIPEGCTTIGARAFADCPELLYVVLPGSVTTVAENAFEGSTKLSN